MHVLLGHHLAFIGDRRLQNLGARGNGHGLGDGADFHSEIELDLGADAQLEIIADGLLEALGRRRHAVGADGQHGESVGAGFVGGGAADIVGGEVLRLNRRAGNYSALGVFDEAADSGAKFLSKQAQTRRERPDERAAA